MNTDTRILLVFSPHSISRTPWMVTPMVRLLLLVPILMMHGVCVGVVSGQDEPAIEVADGGAADGGEVAGEDNVAPGDGNGFAGGNFGNGGFGGNDSAPRDPLADRIDAASKILKAQSDYKLAEAEYIIKIAEARKRIAEAVDVELDVWKKRVLVYFERHEENMRSKMRRKDLYDMAADQTLRLRDTAARRRYEYLKRHPRLSGRGTHTNLNFLLDQFVGTPIGYGIPLEEVFTSNPRHEHWMLDKRMHRQLRVRSSANNGQAIEFRLDQPTPIAFDWPGILQSPAFNGYRTEIEKLNGQLSAGRDDPEAAEDHHRIGERLQRVFALMSREFFRRFPNDQRKGLSTERWRSIKRSEDFLARKTVELDAFIQNPNSVMAVTQTFDPKEDGRDAGTLVAFMTRNGMRFAKPNPGDEAGYHSLYTMMMELYALYGEPLTQVQLTDVPDRPQQPAVNPNLLPDAPLVPGI